MDSGYLLRTVRRRNGWSLRDYSTRAGTSYSTLSDYERGVKVPSLPTLTRLLEAGGYALDVGIVSSAPPTRDDRDTRPRGEQLVEVLDLADQFPSRHSKRLRFPVLRDQLSDRTR
jgi:transcriptional regulator with XRE-family HTH domain